METGPERLPRIVLDASSLVAGLSPGGAADAVVDLIIAGRVQIAGSDDVFAEYDATSSRPSVFELLARKHRSETFYRARLDRLMGLALVVEPAGEAPPCRDENDRMYLHCAATADVDFLVTNDEDLLAEAGNHPFAIVRLAELLSRLRADK